VRPDCKDALHAGTRKSRDDTVSDGRYVTAVVNERASERTTVQ